ncbi:MULTISPECIES: helix-turn-helix domain-containing protein [Nocardia]|uniref:helix-turn-helix domain-containing protein n=1 Tax=Nocardia TaxID=1817 RepID=UPI0007EBF6CE|nr:MULTISPECIES: helix-turn-helix domain-containing protein [Nocardia]MBF6273534.1 helix-turn-helix domain-containing protein [Nocardia nova]OBA44409.1 ArsR family transcriptional regulator [Nocardia sp. 852002-51101_SCH5132738]OBB47840.1 ArsR family transcriptional regulator [Nocardia sp. 852002-51244_SCH5132740]OBF84585.1 ArsR family transcriptional regulator [Mycobacterium sp. 852002-51759_SCH5129042]
MGPIELLAHPVRLRIVHAMSGGHTLTTAQLCARLPDVSKATVYRHVDLLTGGGILEVTEERRVRGAVERHYRLRRERAVIDTDAVAAASRDEHRAVFTTAMTTLLAEFNAYLDRENADPATDSVGYRQHALWLDSDELADLIADLRAAIVPRLHNEPADGRTQYLLSPILFPIGHPHTESRNGVGTTE